MSTPHFQGIQIGDRYVAPNEPMYVYEILAVKADASGYAPFRRLDRKTGAWRYIAVPLHVLDPERALPPADAGEIWVNVDSDGCLDAHSCSENADESAYNDRIWRLRVDLSTAVQCRGKQVLS